MSSYFRLGKGLTPRVPMDFVDIMDVCGTDGGPGRITLEATLEVRTSLEFNDSHDYCND